MGGIINQIQKYICINHSYENSLIAGLFFLSSILHFVLLGISYAKGSYGIYVIIFQALDLFSFKMVKSMQHCQVILPLNIRYIVWFCNINMCFHLNLILFQASFSNTLLSNNNKESSRNIFCGFLQLLPAFMSEIWLL